jgi:hypothetical protein
MASSASPSSSGSLLPPSARRVQPGAELLLLEVVPVVVVKLGGEHWLSGRAGRASWLEMGQLAGR